jgi:putative heme-binding domain-containing protein
LFEALLAANDFLAGTARKPTDEPSGQEFIAPILKDPKQPPAFRVLALRMLRPDHPSLSAADLRSYLTDKDEALRWEAARTLVLRPDDASQEILRQLAADTAVPIRLRNEAVVGLAHSAPSSPITRKMLLSLLDKPELRRDALRSLRDAAQEAEVAPALLAWWDRCSGEKEERRELAAQLVLALRLNKSADLEKSLRPIDELAGARPHNVEEWRAALAGKGDPEAGERIFFHPRGPRCYACHRVDGRGAAIGPDLSAIGKALSRDKLIDSILTPSKEIAPQFTSWLITTRDGKTRTGMIVEEGPDSTYTVADAAGKLEVIQRLEVEERHAVPTSIMPDNLPELLTPQDFLDLLAFLEQRK